MGSSSFYFHVAVSCRSFNARHSFCRLWRNCSVLCHEFSAIRGLTALPESCSATGQFVIPSPPLAVVVMSEITTMHFSIGVLSQTAEQLVTCNSVSWSGHFIRKMLPKSRLDRVYELIPAVAMRAETSCKLEEKWKLLLCSKFWHNHLMLHSATGLGKGIRKYHNVLK